MAEHSGIYADRLSALSEQIAASDLDGVLINPSPTLAYLTGLHFHMSERPVVLCVAPGERPRLVLPELEAAKAASGAVDIEAHTYSEDLATWGIAFRNGLAHLSQTATLGVEPRSLRILELRLIEAGLDGASIVSAEDVVAALRMTKDAEELSNMERAVEIAQDALNDTLPLVKPGITEAEIYSALIQNMLRHGSAGELPFQPIIAFGANSANPHAVATEYAAREGDMILFDWGANYRGYFSDLTRTFALGDPGEKLRTIHATVHRANQAGISAAAPGVPAGDVDTAARKVIDDAGYGEYFVHRTGHGLGLEVHEEPYMRAGNKRELKPGMTFTVEPGIYLDGVGGVRVEDDVVVTEDGSRSLSTLPRELQILPV